MGIGVGGDFYRGKAMFVTKEKKTQQQKKKPHESGIVESGKPRNSIHRKAKLELFRSQKKLIEGDRQEWNKGKFPLSQLVFFFCSESVGIANIPWKPTVTFVCVKQPHRKNIPKE